MADSSADRDPLDRLAEEFVARFRAGERPALTEYAARLPGREDEVRDLFPALVELEQLKPATGEHTGAFAPVTELTDPVRVGEFRILRRVGHGGMGVVYEAVQESLGRHVALKLLPVDALVDPKRLERFRREARAAARLHHTNIVPVFGVGEVDGRHFYAMQFIDGHPLDLVVQDVKRLKENSKVLPNAQRAVSEVAAALVTGVFVHTTPPSAQVDSPAEATLTHVGGKTHPEMASTDPAPTNSGGTSGAGHSYWAAVARIGMQAADALAYAHSQGILHRDIKPANLLLDLRGVVWVTDFGLAKSADADDLTQMGDIVGTLRYMAPERFDGSGDQRADVYALGLTLYELLTLRPAFAADNRAKLVEQALASNPPRPRSINAQIPRDLETIVLKAIARDPAMRYQSAAAMGEDLRRYLEDRPIRARRASSAEQAWRWCRRNPAVASLIASILLVFAAGASVSIYYAAYAITARDAALNAKRSGDRKLFEAYLSDGNATRMSGQAGQRFDALDKVRQALALGDRIDLTDDDIFAARNVAAAALCLPDLAPGRHWDPDAPPDDLSPELRAYIRGRAFARGTPGKFGIGEFDIGVTSLDGRFVVVGTCKWQANTDNPVEVWRVDGPTPARVLEGPLGYHEYAVAFSPDGERVAFGRKNQTVVVYATADGRKLAEFVARPGFMWWLAWHPDSRKLAVVCGQQVRVWDTDADPPSVWAAVPHPTHTGSAAFHPNGRVLATTGTDGFVRVWDVPSGRPLGAWKAFQDGGQTVAFNRAGDRLVGTDWTSTLRLWDAGSGRELARFAHGRPHRFDFAADDTRFGYSVYNGKFVENRVAAGRELRVLNRPTGDGFELIAGAYAPQPGGRLLAMHTNAGLAFVDLYTGRTAAVAPLAASTSHIRFDETGALWTVTRPTANSRAAVCRWAATADQASRRLQLGPPELVAELVNHGDSFSISNDGRTAAIPRYEAGALVVRRGPSRSARLVGPQPNAISALVSPDGRLVATRTHHMDARSDIRIKVWDSASGRLLANIPAGEADYPNEFSADGRWLYTNGGDKIDFRRWDLHSVDEMLVPRWEQTHLGTQMRDASQEVSLCPCGAPAASSHSLAKLLLGRLTSPTQAAVRAERQLRLQEALNGMDPLDREILALRHFEELSNGEAATVLGLTKTAASNRYIRALKRLKEILSALRGIDPNASAG